MPEIQDRPIYSFYTYLKCVYLHRSNTHTHSLTQIQAPPVLPAVLNRLTGFVLGLEVLYLDRLLKGDFSGGGFGFFSLPLDDRCGSDWQAASLSCHLYLIVLPALKAEAREP